MKNEISAKSGTISLDEYIEDLIELGISRDTLTALQPAVAVTRRALYQAGETIFHEGSEVEALYVIFRGRVKLFNYLENGRARIVRLHSRGSIIGLNGLLDESHAHTAMATNEVGIYHIPMQLIKPIKTVDPDTYCQLLEYWHEYLNMADTWITEFSTGPIRGRVARLILFLLETEEDTGPAEVTLLTVEEMADILGVTPESVSRTMADLKRKNLLKPREPVTGDVYNCDIKSLKRIAEN